MIGLVGHLEATNRSELQQLSFEISSARFSNTDNTLDKVDASVQERMANKELSAVGHQHDVVTLAFTWQN